MYDARYSQNIQLCVSHIGHSEFIDTEDKFSFGQFVSFFHLYNS